MKRSKFSIDIINRYNAQDCTLRLIIADCDGNITDIIEGPMRYILREVIERVAPDSKLGIRKVKK